MKYDVIIVGSGPAGYFCAYELLIKNPNSKVLVIEKGVDIYSRKCPIMMGKIDKCPVDTKRKRIGCYPACCITSGFGGAGAFSDGKFNITSEFGGWLSDYISDDEVENIVKDVKERYGANKQPLNEPGEETSTENKENIDENYEKALEIARKARKISASLLQLELHIPYSEASRIINKMEENGIIKGQKGNGRRKVTRKAFKGEE